MKTFETTNTTMIGSLPQKTGIEAMELLEKYPLTIPAWPQLSKRSYREMMVPQYSDGIPGIKIDEIENRISVDINTGLYAEIGTFYESVMAGDTEAFAIKEESAAGLHVFLKNLKKAGKKYPVLKAQVTGPLTYGLGVNDQNKRPVWFNKEYRDVAIKGMAMKGRWLLEQLKPYADKVLIFFDEPVMSALGTPSYIGIQEDEVVDALNECIDAVQADNVEVGCHICGNLDLDMLIKTKLNIIAFDAFNYGKKLALYPKSVTEFLARGGTLAWGLVPTDSGSTVEKVTLSDIQAKIENLVELYLSKGIPEELLFKKIIITPSCGLGPLTHKQSEKVLSLTRQLLES